MGFTIFCAALIGTVQFGTLLGLLALAGLGGLPLLTSALAGAGLALLAELTACAVIELREQFKFEDGRKMISLILGIGLLSVVGLVTVVSGGLSLGSLLTSSVAYGLLLLPWGLRGLQSQLGIWWEEERWA